ncbi:MAG TPA: hypothetical protein VMZ00_16945 [Sporichthya sp.]|nr:hypothetical protein [Sporichthya sp.]
MRTDSQLGGTLADRLRSGPLDRGELDQLARDLLGMLVSLHAEGTLHRDLHPASVRLDSAGRLHSSKIGAQRTSGDHAPGGPTGPRNYVAPEVLAGGTSDTAADLFACGVLLADAAGPDASAPVLVLIGMLTAPERDLRPASAAEALELLGGAPAPEPVKSVPPAPRTPPVAGYRPTFEKPTGALPAMPPASPPVVAPADVPTAAIEFPPVVDFPPVEPLFLTQSSPPAVEISPAYPPASYSPAAYPSAPPVLPRLRRRPSRRVVLAAAAVVAGLAIAVTGVKVLGGDDPAQPTIPAPTEAPLHQQLDDLDSAIELVTK